MKIEPSMELDRRLAVGIECNVVPFPQHQIPKLGPQRVYLTPQTKKENKLSRSPNSLHEAARAGMAADSCQERIKFPQRDDGTPWTRLLGLHLTYEHIRWLSSREGHIASITTC